MTTRVPAALDDVPALGLFLEVASAGSFSRAAKKRGLTTSAVSKRIALLEARLGLTLLARTTRRLSVTDAGRRLLARAERVLGELADAEDELSELALTPKGVLRVATSVSLGQSHVGRIALDFVAQNPRVSVELAVAEELVDLVADGFDLGIRCGTIRDTTDALTMKKIVPSKRVLCAAPSYLERRGVPERVEDLAEHECLRHVVEQDGRTWRLAGTGRTVSVDVHGSFHSDNPFVVLDATLAGAGIAFLSSFVIADHVKAGRLKVVLEGFGAEKGWVYLAFPIRKPPPLTRAFADFVVERMKSSLA